MNYRPAWALAQFAIVFSILMFLTGQWGTPKPWKGSVKGLPPEPPHK